MMKRSPVKFASGLALAAALLASPTTAQDDTGEMDKVMSAMQAAFPADPLTAEEDAKLPAASEAVAKIIPDGIYARMMNDVMGGMLGALAGQMTTMSAYEIAANLGVSLEEAEGYDEATRAEITNLIDPAFAERGELSMEAMTASLTEIMADMEPSVRAGLSRAYAQRFTAQQLADINAFFATPSGAVYASESMLVFTDPQVMSGSMEAMPKMMEAMPAMMVSITEATADLPPERGFADLSESQRTRLAELAGLSIEDLAVGMEIGAEDSGEYGADVFVEDAE